jgi:hypothetical protein
MALRIAQFLVHLYSNKRPGFTQLKADYKTALDTVCKFIDHPSLSSKHGNACWSFRLMLALAFEVNAASCDSYLREFIDPLKFLTCVKGSMVLTSIPVNSDGLDIEGSVSNPYVAHKRFVLHAREYSSKSVSSARQEQSKWWGRRSHTRNRTFSRCPRENLVNL